MLKTTLLAAVLLFNSLSPRAQLIDNFDDNILTNWFAQSCYSLAETNQELSVAATNAFNYLVFNKQSLNENFSTTKVLYLKIKTAASLTVRVDLKDIYGVSTNASPLSISPITDGAYHVYTLDFNNRFRQSFPSTALVDSTAIGQVIIFFNPAGPAFTGNVFFDSVGHRPDLITLPAHFISFTGQVNAGKVTLSFKVAEETDVDRYIIRRSADNLHWQNIAELTPFNTGGDAQYSFTDATPSNGSNIYRIEILKKSGAVIYSSIWKYQLNNSLFKTKVLHIAQDQYQLVFSNNSDDPPLFANTYTFAGQLLKRTKLSTGQQTILINVNIEGLIVIKHRSGKQEIFKLPYR